ncbi:MAG: hypothetical protein IPH74_06895 [Bacteroidetes bacterium]|jgi:hypothetical protein|nr:hypothetical protein [Bacteroidota bacterium]MBP7256014.1 hypothetical protein [Chitinophagales bacterium]MBK7138749.1 hypothetical protein [Bacteroidota bacterium]MBK7505262.1 hypothetical protein [Bacteroidota bacterium]MBK7640443.1 hypothetical protein [Bacteroidota bacterium]
MKGKKIKKGENKSNDQPDRLVKKEIDVENLAQTMEFQTSLSPELDEILKKNPKHFLGCGG